MTSEKQSKVVVGQTVWVNEPCGRRGMGWQETTVAKVGRVYITLANRDADQFKIDDWRHVHTLGGGKQIRFSREDVDADEWLAANRHGLVKAIESCTDVDLLKQIAALVCSAKG